MTSLALLITAGLVACGPDKNETDTASSTTTASTSGATDTSGETGTPTTSGAEATGGETGASGTGSASGETGGTTGESGESTTGVVGGCEALATQGDCEQDPGCMAVVGQALDFPGCMPGQTFIACMPTMPCDSVILDICQDEPGQEVYELSNGCIPPGFSACDPGDIAMCAGAACEGLPEQGCLAAPNCTALMGAPHIEVDGEVCVDFAAQQFLACAEGELACPPVIATVCPEGQPDMAFDTGSGCVPPGFVACDMPAPECP